MISDTFADKFVAAIDACASMCHQIAKDHGWWEVDRNDGEMIALQHSELSEALEAIRDPRKEQSNKIPFLGVEEEYADLVIRVLDTCHARGWRLAEAILAKMAYNENRPYRHGGKSM